MPTLRNAGRLIGSRSDHAGRRLASLAGLGINPDELAWQNDANCQGTDPDEFFPDVEYGGNVQLVKRVCAACPVRAACLDYALAHPDLVGIWGGVSTHRRQQLRKTTHEQHPAEEAA